jgi:catechol 2,3-dioxygenase-like lactoylglutathione lyase family enzyme
MAKAIHSMIRVLDLARSIDFYDRALGLKVYEQFEFDISRSRICATKKTSLSWN